MLQLPKKILTNLTWLKPSPIGGSISLDALKGTIRAITSGGSIKATELRGESIVKTSGGSFILREIYGTLDAATSAGSLDAEILAFHREV